MNLSNITTFIFITAFATTGMVLTSCSSDNDDHDDEIPVGIVLSISGQDILIQDSGTLTYTDGGDRLMVSHGGLLGVIDVEFIAEDGDRFTPDTGEYGLSYTIGDDTILDIQHPVGGNEWRINLAGTGEGTTTFRLRLMHEGHSDFDTQDILVEVETGAVQ